MSNHKEIVEKYIDGFRHSDHAKILACLTDDIVWNIHGYRTLEGKPAFDGEINNENFTGSPTLNLEHLIEEGDRVAVMGNGQTTDTSGKVRNFVFCDVFAFRDGLVRQIDTYHVWRQ